MIRLRKAVLSDVDLLFKWANDSSVRQNSFKSDPIPYEAHVQWFDKMMKDESILQFILMDEDTPVGQIRLNIDGSSAEIGYSIAAEYRGKGYGHKILQLMLDEVKINHGTVKTLIAKVKPNNAASNSLFLQEGYSPVYTSYKLKVSQ